MQEGKLRVKMRGMDSDTLYVFLPGYPAEPKCGIVTKTICLDDILSNFSGPRVNLDFDKTGQLVGIEVLA